MSNLFIEQRRAVKKANKSRVTILEEASADYSDAIRRAQDWEELTGSKSEELELDLWEKEDAVREAAREVDKLKKQPDWNREFKERLFEDGAPWELEGWNFTSNRIDILGERIVMDQNRILGMGGTPVVSEPPPGPPPGPPPIPNGLNVIGITDPVDSWPIMLFRVIDNEGKPQWADNSENWIVYWSGGYWNLIHTSFYAASNESEELTPVNLTGWDVAMGAGQPEISSIEP